LSINLQRISKGGRANFQELVTDENFHTLLIDHSVFHPCVQAMRFVEQDHIALCHVYPALKTLKRHLTQPEDPLNVDMTECLDYWRRIAGLVRQRQRNLFDMDLVKVAFWLTSFGSTWVARQEEFIPENHRLHLPYESPRKVPVRRPLDAMTAEAAPGLGPSWTNAISRITDTQAMTIRTRRSEAFHDFKS
jgi:hypothetical protein